MKRHLGRRLICFFRGHNWEATWYDEYLLLRHYKFSMRCRRCGEGVDLRITVLMAPYHEGLEWEVIR